MISYMEVNEIFCTRIDFAKIFVMSLDFVDVKNYKTCPREWQTGRIKPFKCFIWFISDETIWYQIKSLCLILGVDGCLSFLHILVVYIHFSYYLYGFQNGRQRSRDYFLLLSVQIKVIYISNILSKLNSNRLNGSWGTPCWTHIPSIFRGPWNMLGTEVLVWQRKC